ncbi:hypothetical protein CFP56_022362 [Quercus suber]|uniref:Uncharacterized protein n=1 Tax=Quercus suber TaxID=58331 RepID=A0AAW0KFC2_QUESU
MLKKKKTFSVPSSDVEHRCKHIEKEKSMGINTVRLHICHNQIVGTGSDKIKRETKSLRFIKKSEGHPYESCHPSSLHHFKIHPISLYLKFDIFEGDYIMNRANRHDFHIEVHLNLFSTDEIKNVVVGKSKNDNSIENQQIEAAYTSAKCFANVARLTK